jgi:hypothetical protein
MLLNYQKKQETKPTSPEINGVHVLRVSAGGKLQSCAMIDADPFFVFHELDAARKASRFDFHIIILDWHTIVLRAGYDQTSNFPTRTKGDRYDNLL